MEEPENRLSRNHVSSVENISYNNLIEAMLLFEPQVMGLMHSTVETTNAGLNTLFDYWQGPVMAYPETSSQVRKGVSQEIEPSVFARHCHDWVNKGVQIIGGCCGTTIEHIRALVYELSDVISDRH